MAADVSSAAEGKRELVTRDLLGGAAVLGSPEVDLELQVPAGWERRLDLASGQTYLQKQHGAKPSSVHLHDLNFPPPQTPAPPPPTNSTYPDLSTSLGLKLTAAAPASAYSSICTLEKVKFALERAAELESRATADLRLPPAVQQLPLQLLHPCPVGGLASSPSTSSHTTTSSMKRRRSGAAAAVDEASESSGCAATAEASDEASEEMGMMAVAACPVCLFYVLVSRMEPRCPKCEAHVPVAPPREPAASPTQPQNLKKKAKISLDLNSSIQIDDDD